MMLKLRLVLVCLSISGFSFSQNYIFKQFSTDQGLPDKYIYSLTQDRDGFLWISTAKGLVCFDGQIFKKQETSKSADDFIYSSTIDRNGNLWFGTFSGKLYKREFNSKKIVALKDSTGTSINRIVASHINSAVYLLCRGKGIYCVQYDKLIEVIKTEDYLVNDIRELDNKRLLLSTSEGLRVYNSESRSVEKVEGFDSETGLLQEHLDKKSTFWLNVPTRGLVEIEVDELNRVKELNAFSDNDIINRNEVACFYFDEENNYLFVTGANERLGLINISTREQKVFSEEDYFGSANFMFKGRQKNIWVCTNGKGLFRLYRAEYDIIPLEESVYAISQDEQGNMYYGTKNGILVSSLKSGPHKSIKKLDGKELGKVNALFFDNRNLWVGTENKGVFVVDPKTLKSQKLNFSPIANIGINSISDGHSPGYVQVNTNLDGAYLYKDYNLLYNFSVKNSLLHNNVYHSIRMKNGKVYYATHNTAFNFSTGDKLYEISINDNGLISDFNMFAKAKNETLYAATDGDGIYYIEDSIIRPFELNERFESKYVLGLLFDRADNLWIQQQYNLYEYYNREKVLRKIKFYDKSQFLFNPNACFLNKQGDLFFGCNHGVVRFNAATTNNSINYANAYITRLKVNDSTRSIGTPLQLKSGKYVIAFEFSALGQKNSEDISFRYILEGRDNSWSEPTKQKHVEFSNLSEGNYTFKLEAINSDGFAQKKWAEYSFAILKPIWKHTWFWIVLFITIVVTVTLIIRWRTASLVKAKVALERIVEEKTVEIRNEKEIVEQNSKVIEAQHHEITQSINYAKRIQEAILPEFRNEGSYSPEVLVFFLPKDIVSGDFYWHALKSNRFLIAACDCTGHGVPGAFMSLIGSTLLNKIVLDKGIVQPEMILSEIDSEISISLKQESNEVRDGMETAVCSFDFGSNKLHYAGAKRPLWVFVKTHEKYKLNEYSANKFPIGGFADVKEKAFTAHEIPIAKGDTIYMFSDGIIDQFDNANKKRLSTKRVREFLSSIVHLSFKEQQTEISNFFNSWKQDTKQTDDVLVIGIRI